MHKLKKITGILRMQSALSCRPRAVLLKAPAIDGDRPAVAPRTGKSESAVRLHSRCPMLATRLDEPINFMDASEKRVTSNSDTDPKVPVNYVFVDYENVHDVDLTLIGKKTVYLTLLLGARQSKLDAGLVEKSMENAASVQLVRLNSSGRNALDFATKGFSVFGNGTKTIGPSPRSKKFALDLRFRLTSFSVRCFAKSSNTAAKETGLAENSLWCVQSSCSEDSLM